MRVPDAEARTASPFTPQPEARPWLTVGLSVAAVVLLLALAAWLAMRPGGARPSRAAPAPSSVAAPPAPAASAADPPRTSAPVAPTVIPGRPALSSVNKCLQRGRTSYSDGPCPAGATAVELDVAPDVNLMEAPALPPPPGPVSQPALPGPRAEATGPVRAPAGLDAATRCPALARDIDQLDAMARMPQPAQVQDWITARKRELRDLQFRLKC